MTKKATPTPPGTSGAEGRGRERKETASRTLGDARFPVVAMGGSAGGLDAFKEFFSRMPEDAGIAFILIPHLDPTHKSLMVELLSRCSRMPVCEAVDGAPIEADHIYVIPPDRELAVRDGRLRITPLLPPRRLRTGIDLCFRTLAADQGEKAIGVVLSGTGSHGTLGLKEIKLAGGMVMAQEPSSAAYDSMPRSAIATGLVDFVLPPGEMPDAILRYAQQPYLRSVLEGRAMEETSPKQLDGILALLRVRTKRDFRCYRKGMLMRRVQRRMGLLHIRSIPDYLNLLGGNEDEVAALSRDLLIGVTSFFRESEAFDVLARDVIPELIERKAPVDGSISEHPVRVWVPGCATGEEAYSLAILLIEAFSQAGNPANIQIFATDIDAEALDFARRGLYPECIAADLTPERLRRFFIPQDNRGYLVNKELRDTVVFASQNLIGDAPFSKLDLVSCRNLLIYFEPEMQAKVIRLFHFALSEGGYLLLGPSESIGRETDLFKPVSKRWRVYRRCVATRMTLVDIPIGSGYVPQAASRHRDRVQTRENAYRELTQRIVLEEFSPAGALVNRAFEILSVTGPLVDYLEFPPGEPTRNLLAMARPGLRTRIRAVASRAIRGNVPVVDEEARVERSGRYHACRIVARPVSEPNSAGEELLLVLFEDLPTALPEQHPGEEGEAVLARQLEYELRTTREELESTIGEQESANEELKVSNEEMMSMNEELQSANEELETSKEELQSLNEELTTVNNQLAEKVNELDKEQNDIINLLASTEIVVIFLDSSMRIRRLTPATDRIFNLRATDIGRPIGDFSSRVFDAALVRDAGRVLRNHVTVEKEVRSENGACYLRRIQPYRTSDGRIEGVVVIYVDITRRLAAEANERRLESVLRGSNDAIVAQDLDGRILSWNHGAERLYGFTEAEALEMNFRRLVPEDHRDGTREIVQRITEGDTVSSLRSQRINREGRVFDVWLTITKIEDEAGRVVGIATTERDLTELRETEEKLRVLMETIPHGLHAVDLKGRILYCNPAHDRMFGFEPGGMTGKCVLDFLADEAERERVICRMGEILEKHPLPEPYSMRIQDRNGKVSDIQVDWEYKRDSAGEVTGFISVLTDITERRNAQIALQKLNESLEERVAEFDAANERLRLSEFVVANSNDAILLTRRDGTIFMANEAAEQLTGYSREQLLRMNKADIDAGFEMEEWERSWKSARTQPHQFRESQLRTRVGRLLQIEVSRSFIEFDDTRLLCCIMRDVSRRHAMENELRERELRLRAIMETAPDAIVTMDSAGIIELFNPAAEKIFGYRAKEAVGESIARLCPEQQGLSAEGVERSPPGVLSVVELSAHRKDGSVCRVEASVCPIGKTGKFVGIYRDISERTKLETEILRISEEEKRRFAGELHDGICQDLAALSFMANTLGRDLASTSKTEEVPRVEEIGRLIAEVLNEARRLSHALMPVMGEPEGLMNALRNLAAKTRTVYKKDCVFQCAEEVPVKSASAALHLYRIAQGAVGNAIQHGNASRITISLLEEDGRIVLKIMDNGSGFPQKRESSGGIGLRVMDYRARSMHGSLLARNRKGGGVEVICTIPTTESLQ